MKRVSLHYWNRNPLHGGSKSRPKEGRKGLKNTHREVASCEIHRIGSSSFLAERNLKESNA